VGVSWRAWAPPLNPPDERGLPEAYAEEVAALYWLTDPWLAAAMMWEAYAAGLPPEAPVVQVATGVQSVTYGAGGGGAWAQAMARAEQFRAMRGSLHSVPLRLSVPPGPEPWPDDWWQRDYDDPATWEAGPVEGVR
jgi:hypothetical protein